MAFRIRGGSKQQKRVHKRLSFSENIQNILFESTLHGLKFIGDSNLTIWERLYYSISFVIVCIISACLISNIYVKWCQSPVIVGINPNPTYIHQIPFPAITICNMNQASKSKTSKYNHSSLEYAMLQMLCLTPTTQQSHIEHKNVQKFSKFILKNSQPCSKMMVYCRFGGIEYNCIELFYEYLADEGLCCVFNAVHPQFLLKGYFEYEMMKNFNPSDGKIPVDWSPETGYPERLPIKYYPAISHGKGISQGLTVVLNAAVEDYTCSSTNGPGFKVALHNPIDTPLIKETGLSVELDRETNFRIEPSHSEASPSIRTINKLDRRCLFNNEHSLLYYRYYTRHNCEMECDAMFMLLTCNCIPYNMPILFENSTVCTVKDYGCVVKAEKKYLITDEENNKCKENCLPSCFDLTFSTNSFKNDIVDSTGEYLTANYNLENLTEYNGSKNLAIVHFYYRDNMFVGSMKTNFIVMTDFLSSTGGLMGLFMGFSVISVAEFIFYIFLRPVFELRTRKQTKGVRGNEFARKLFENGRIKNLKPYPKSNGGGKILKTLESTKNMGNLAKAALFKSEIPKSAYDKELIFYYLKE